MYVFENKYEFKNKAKTLMHKNREKFTHSNMTKLLNKIVDKYTQNLPSQVGLKLPKLKRVGGSKTEQPKIKLPKLKKVTTTEGVSV